LKLDDVIPSEKLLEDSIKVPMFEWIKSSKKRFEGNKKETESIASLGKAITNVATCKGATENEINIDLKKY
jgi:hypothetical protein